MNNVMFGMMALGVWEFLLILLVVIFWLAMAGGIVFLVVWLIRRGNAKSHAIPAVQPQPPQPEPAPSTCPRCGTPLPIDSPQGLCPRCVMGVGLATQTEATGEFGPHGTKVVKPLPLPADIAKNFPQLEILDCLGRGGMGVVYKARQPKLNRLVALKILAPEKGADPKFAERFLREAQALARLSHPNIVTVHDFGEADGMFYLLMEFVDGATLRQLLREGRMKPETALTIVPRICEALQFAHEQGVVHRDIKPENVLLDKQGRVKIADFGIAKIVAAVCDRREVVEETMRRSQTAAAGNLTQDQVLGTPHYMAPEQVEHPQTVDHRADIYSLGVVFYEMLTGELPLGKFQPPSKKVQVDVRLDEVVLHALEKEPERRYQHVSEVKTDVETISHSPASSAPAAGERPDGISGWLRRSLIPEDTAARWARWLSFGAALVILVLGFLELPKFDLRPHELFFGVVLVLILTFVILAAGYLVGAVGSHRLRQGLTPRPDEPAASGEGTSQGQFTLAPTANRRSGLGKVAFGLFLAGILGSLLLAALLPRQGELVFILGVVELLLSLILGLMSWHERFGRIAVIGNVVLAGLASLVFTVMVVTRPIKRAEMENRVKAEIAAKREATERKAEEARLASPSFGPVMESVLKAPQVQPEGRVAELLDLDTGRRGTSANFGDNDRETHAWLRTNQLDVLGVIEHGQIAVLCFDTVVMPAVNNDWETVTAQNLVTNWNLAQLEPKNITGLTPVTDNTDTWLFRTREGGRGLLQILGQSSDPLGVKIRYKLVQRADFGAASQPSPVPARRVIAQAPFSARLPEGEVELVALSHYPSTNEPWWAPDGGAPKEGPFVTEASGDSSADFRMFAVVARLRNVPANASKPHWITEPRNSWADGKAFAPDEKAGGKLVMISCKQPRSAATANVKVGIASGDWETVARARADAVNPGGQPSTNGVAMFPPLGDSEEGVRVTVTHNYKGMDIRLIALESDGSSRGGTNLDQSLSEAIGHTTMTFPGLSLKQAAQQRIEFHFQVRPYQWVEFHNVSLKPGQRTQVEVRDAALQAGGGDRQPHGRGWKDGQ